MPGKKWTFTVLDDADAVAEFLNENEIDPSQVHIAIANQDKFYVFYFA